MHRVLGTLAHISLLFRATPPSHLTFVFAKRLARDCVVCTNGSKSHQLIGRTRNRMRLPRGEPEEKERKILEALHWCSYFRCERERSVKGMNFQSIDLLSGRQEMLLTFICPHWRLSSYDLTSWANLQIEFSFVGGIGCVPGM